MGLEVEEEGKEVEGMNGKLAKKPNREGFCRLSTAATSFVCCARIRFASRDEVRLMPGEEMLRMDLAIPASFKMPKIDG